MKVFMFSLVFYLLLSCTENEKDFDKNKIKSSISKNRNVQVENFDSIKIGEQIWMVENLNVYCFRNGDSIPHAKTVQEWIKAGKEKKPAWCYYDNSKEKNKKYGKLYNWYAVNDSRGIAPNGWMVPSKKDWEIMIKYFGGLNVLSEDLMSESEWLYGGGSNKSGFNALPAGGRVIKGKFENKGISAYFWISTSADMIDEIDRAFFLTLTNDHSALLPWPKEYGLSVRCIRK